MARCDWLMALVWDRFLRAAQVPALDPRPYRGRWAACWSRWYCYLQRARTVPVKSLIKSQALLVLWNY